MRRIEAAGCCWDTGWKAAALRTVQIATDPREASHKPLPGGSADCPAWPVLCRRNSPAHACWARKIRAADLHPRDGDEPLASAAPGGSVKPLGRCRDSQRAE